MISRITKVMGAALAVIAAVMVVAVPAGAGNRADVHVVSGSEALGQVSGDLEGEMIDAPGGFESFLATRKLTPGGILTWRMPVVFRGCIVVRRGDDLCGLLHLDAHLLYRFKPGTTLYDFSPGAPEYQPGTTGDPAAWLSGGSVSQITGGDCDLEGASGVLIMRETAFLSAHTYRGIIRI